MNCLNRCVFKQLDGLLDNFWNEYLLRIFIYRFELIRATHQIQLNPVIQLRHLHVYDDSKQLQSLI